MTTVIEAPGLYDLDEQTYHSDPTPTGSLSSSGARKLLPPNCPALFQYQRQNRPAPKAVFDIGHAAHMLVLGIGDPVEVIDAKDWRTKAANEAADEARAEGKTPLLAADWEMVQAMAAALKVHPVAGPLFHPDSGKAEQSLFWRDERTGVTCRARTDWMHHPLAGVTTVVDYKTTISASPESFAKSCATYGYHQQAPFYIDGIRALDIAQDVTFLFVAQEKTAPYLVSVYELGVSDLEIGERLNRQALDIYAECDATGYWPGYVEGVTSLALPGWYARQFEDVA